MSKDFLELLADGPDAADERVRLTAFECLFNGLDDERVASLFTLLGWSGDFTCYAIAGTPAVAPALAAGAAKGAASSAGGHAGSAAGSAGSAGTTGAAAGSAGYAGAVGTKGAKGAATPTPTPIPASGPAVATAATAARMSITRTIAGLGGDSLIGEHDGLVIALVRQSGAATPEVTCTHTLPAFAADRPVCLGPSRQGVSGAMHTVRAVLFALKAAPAVSPHDVPRPMRADDVLPERALIGDEDARRELVSSVYGSLTAGGPDDPTLLTVSTFLQCGGSLETVAKELNVHPNTVRYRLKRAAESTGWDATDPREAYVLTTAIALGRIHTAH
ncbi:PucR family transcriptional regulator [Bifidobacterium lemurum]|nr:helix-turn-helix domain-containing protein [Bifidobacterium lemurum]